MISGKSPAGHSRNLYEATFDRATLIINSDNFSSYLIVFHLISSLLISSHLISSYFIWSHLFSSHLILSHRISSYFIVSHLFSSYHLILSHLISSYIILSHLISSYIIYLSINLSVYVLSIYAYALNQWSFSPSSFTSKNTCESHITAHASGPSGGRVPWGPHLIRGANGDLTITNITNEENWFHMI